MLIKVLKDYLAELEETLVGGRKISRLVLDVREGKVDVEFADDQLAHDEESRLATYEACSFAIKERYRNDFDRWKKRLKLMGMLTREKYLQRVTLELKELLNSDFLIPEMDLLTREQRVKAQGELEGMGLDVQLCDKFAWFTEMTTMKGGVYEFKSDELLDNYLKLNKDCLSQKSIEAMLQFRYAMEIITHEIPAEAKAVASDSKAKREVKERTTMTFGKGNGVADGHISILYAKLTKAGWMDGTAEDFKDLFSGKSKTCWLTWKGKFGKSTLEYLFAQMIEAKVVKLPDGFTLSSILEGHFKDAEGLALVGLGKGDEPNRKAIGFVAECVHLLTIDPSQMTAEEFNELYGNAIDTYDHQDLNVRKRRL